MPPHSRSILPLLGQLEGCLVVEDDSIILLNIEHTLRHLGLMDVRTATTLARAAELATDGDIRFAILDYELGSTTSLPLADQLIAQNATILFLTAHGGGLDLPVPLRHVPVVSKPFTTALLEEAIVAALGAAVAVRDRD